MGGDVRVFFARSCLGFSVVVDCHFFSLVVVRIVYSGSHVGLHVNRNGIDKMGVSSSSGWSRFKWSGVSPLCMCSLSCLAVR